MRGTQLLAPTLLLRRFVHYLWECFSSQDQIRVRLRHVEGDELHIEQDLSTLTVTIRYFGRRALGEMVKDVEVVCFIEDMGEWIPYILDRSDEGRQISAEPLNCPHKCTLIPLDAETQRQIAGFCDAWAFQLLEEAWLAEAAKLRLPQPTYGLRPQWPKPTQPLPALETLENWYWDDGGCEATDGCWTAPDGICEHGHPSWLRRMALL